jgi:hypothetical protein
VIVKMVGVGKDKKLGDVSQLYATSQKALAQSAPRLRSLCRSLLGLSKQDDEAFSEFDPHGEFQDAIYSNDMQAAAAFLVENGSALPKAARAKDEDAALERLTSAELEAIVTRGSDTDDGDWFRNTLFRPLVSAEGDEDEEDDEEDAPDSEERPAHAAKKKASKRPADEEDDDDDDDDEDEEDDEPESEPAPRAKKRRASASNCETAPPTGPLSARRKPRWVNAVQFRTGARSGAK